MEMRPRKYDDDVCVGQKTEEKTETNRGAGGKGQKTGPRRATAVKQTTSTRFPRASGGRQGAKISLIPKATVRFGHVVGTLKILQ